MPPVHILKPSSEILILTPEENTHNAIGKKEFSVSMKEKIHQPVKENWFTESVKSVSTKDGSPSSSVSMKKELSGFECVSGKQSVLRTACLTSQMVCVYPYPLTKQAYLDRQLEEATKSSKPNCYGEVCHVEVLETTGDCGRSLQGILSRGLTTSVVCSSTSLLEMFPKLQQLAKQRLCCVFHVAAFGLDKENLSTVGDYSHMLQVAQTGLAQLHSTSVQEVHDLSIVAHMVSSGAKIPIVHFFDGPRLGNEISKVNVMPDTKLGTLLRGIPKYQPVVKKQIPDIIDGIMDQMKQVFGRRYRLFEYVGHPAAEHIVVAFCSKDDSSVLTNITKQLIGDGSADKKKVGVVHVRLLQPWSAKHLVQVLPPTLKSVAVLSSASAAAGRQLFADVTNSLYQYPERFQNCQTFNVLHPQSDPNNNLNGLNPGVVQSLFTQLLQDPAKSVITFDDPCDVSSSVSSSDFQKVIVWNSIADGEATVAAGLSLLTLVGSTTKGFVHGSQVVDHYQMGGAVAVSHLSFGRAAFSSPPLDSPASCVVCTNVDLLGQFNIAGKLCDAGVLVLNLTTELAANLDQVIPVQLRQEIALRNLRLHIVDTDTVLDTLKLTGADDKAAAALGVFLQMIILRASGLCQSLDELRSFLKNHLSQQVGAETFEEMVEIAMVEGADAIVIPEAWKFPPILADLEEKDLEGKDSSAEEEKSQLEEVSEGKEALKEDEQEDDFEDKEEVLEEKELPKDILRPSLLPAFTSSEDSGSSCSVSGTHKAAWLMMYPEAHETTQVLKPFEHETTFMVRTTVNRRLTPSDYSRNVFHIEFDISGTGLTYEIGEALGVYGLNPADEVKEFLAYHNFDPNSMVEITNDKGEVEMRSVEQTFTQVLDIFGRPGRRFYESLAAYAEDPKEKEKLEWLAGPEGGPAFKKGVENLVNYADLLETYKSVKMGVDDLVREVPCIKPRHYSIASSMKAHPNSVHLLVVVVEWKSSGKKRFGLASNYLENLNVGDMVTVDVKPSVMKLPKESTAPLMMAGLGTGMAPFRAFIEERAWQREQGMPVGPITLYFGSRSQYKEYLYGEELEAYHDSGLLTNLRCAFSRDQEHKVYIQHKMQEDSQIIVDDLVKDETGCFYLCGPTWPAADVQDAIQDALQNIAGFSEEETRVYIRDMKETERYVLEVY